MREEEVKEMPQARVKEKIDWMRQVEAPWIAGTVHTG
jgi:hypothetical protein